MMELSQHDIVVRLPMEFASAAMAASFVERLVATALIEAGLGGVPVIEFVDEDGRLMEYSANGRHWEVKLPVEAVLPDDSETA